MTVKVNTVARALGVLAVAVGMVINVSLILSSGVNILLTSDLGLTLAAWETSPLLAAVSILLLLVGFGVILSTVLNPSHKRF